VFSKALLIIKYFCSFVKQLYLIKQKTLIKILTFYGNKKEKTHYKGKKNSNGKKSNFFDFFCFRLKKITKKGIKWYLME